MVDNLTILCPDCGTREALQSIVVLMKNSRRKHLILFIGVRGKFYQFIIMVHIDLANISDKIINIIGKINLIR